MTNFLRAPNLSRRQLLRSSAVLGMGGLAASFPLRALADGHAAHTPWPSVTAMVESYVSTRKTANMLAAMGWGQDAPQFIASGQRAFSGGGAVGPDTLYRIYSMTKPVTGMAAMICIDEGLLSLDQPIAELLPAFGEMQVQKAYDGAITSDNLEPAKRLITVRQLLTHTAGLGYTITQSGPIKAAYEANGINPGYVTRLPGPDGKFQPQPAPSLAAFADELAKLPLVLQPGERWSYSVSLDLLGRVIEVAAGQEFGAFLKERIFDPCGMTSTSFQLAEEDIDRFVTNYFLINGLPLPIDPPESSVYLPEPAFPFGGAGLVSSARDYDRFLQMLLGYGVIEGRRVMSEPAVRLGASDLLPETATTEGSWVAGKRFGAGGAIEADGSFGWAGAAGTIAAVNFKAGLRATLMTQYMPSDVLPVHADFPTAVREDLAAMAAAAP